MSDKKSFLLSKTWKPMIDAMTRDDKADLLQAIFDYACDGEVFEDKTSAVYPIFALIKATLDEDEKKYEETCEKNERNTAAYRWFREAVLLRDGYTCQLCGSHHNLHVHHIKPFALYEGLRTDVSNGVTLCANCHRRIHFGRNKR